MKKILVTGAYGYIGSHTVKTLVEHGHNVYALDLYSSVNDISKYVPSNQILMKDVTHRDHLAGDFDAVVHLAGVLDIEESVFKPWYYAKTNVEGTFTNITRYPTDNFIFASTAAAFNPISPYAQTKMLAESIIKAHCKNYTIFRFYNVAGNNNEFKQIGRATHLIRIAAETAAGKRPSMTINGTDWETYDGTCIRDYVHVQDLVEGIVKAIDNPSNKDYECVGSGTNYSVRDVVNVMKDVTGINFEVKEGPRRAGDSAVVTIPEGKISNYINCSRTIEDMCLSAYQAELN